MRGFVVTISLSIAASFRCHALLINVPVTPPSIQRYSSHHTSIARHPSPNTVLSASESKELDTTATTSTTNPSSILTDCKLIYFPLPGRGEAIRLALTIGGIPFVDERVPFRSWGNVKPTTPWGTLPVLELADGSRLAQARTLLRLVGQTVGGGLYPENVLLAQRVDEFMDAMEDLGDTVTNVGQGLSKEGMEAAREASCLEPGGEVHTFLGKIDAFIGEHGSGGHVVGDQMTIASLLAFTNFGRLAGGVYFGVPSTVCDAFPNIQLVRKTVGSDPAVVKWYDDRAMAKSSLSPAERVLANSRNL